MANAKLALLHSAFDARTGQMLIRPPEGAPLLADTRSEAGRAAIATFLAGFLGEEARGTPHFVEAPGHNSPMWPPRRCPSSAWPACMPWNGRPA
ncbi:hypothetical protein ACFQY5_12020 [Paeniroseomonas aquatica]|uniref:hypothetical protein n=1 Tax=Paeniroseomonas aquatica TaxID=373043 RepID=UPI003605AE32